MPLGFFQVDAGKIVDHDGKPENQNINRDKSHIKIAAADQKQKPTVLMRKYKKKRSNYDEEENKLNRIKKHN
jgi:hypothetical protein